MSMNVRRVESCGLCASHDLEPVLHLGHSPAPCVMVAVGAREVAEDRYPLELLVCHHCSLVQSSVIIDAATVFPSDYTYSSGNSRALHDNFEDLAFQAGNWLGLQPDDLVVDIGANDGTLLSKFGCRTVGVEPTGQAERIQGPAYREFFGRETAERILAKHGPARVITACNVLAHVDDIHDVMAGIALLLADDGMLIAENHDLASIVTGGQWDTVYHEHLRYYSPYSFSKLLELYGLNVQAVQQIPTHGGSFRTYATATPVSDLVPPVQPEPVDWEAFRRTVNRARWVLRSDIASLRAGGRRVAAIGATARATTIVNACGFDVDDIEAVYEVPGSDKIGFYVPGTRIPIVEESVLRQSYAPDCAILFAWYMADHIIPKLRLGERGYKGQIIIPLPILQHLRTAVSVGQVAGM
jgi:hypothetical protein